MELGLIAKRADVTGASGGIGPTPAQWLASEGSALAMRARGGEPLQASANELKAQGVKAFDRVVDVVEQAPVTAFLGDAADALGGLDSFASHDSAVLVTGPVQWSTNSMQIRTSRDLIPLSRQGLT